MSRHAILSVKIVFISLFFLGFSNIYGAKIQGGESVHLDEVFKEDLYVAGGELDINGSVKGDANLTGGNIHFSATTSSDANIAGGEVFINSNIGDDLHVAAGQTTISGTVNGDVFAAGGELTLTEDSVINGDVYIAGGYIKVKGKIKGSLIVRGGQVNITGEVKGKLDLYANASDIRGSIGGDSIISSEKLMIGSDARFGANVEYWTEDDVDFSKNLTAGKATFNPELEQKIKHKWSGFGFFIFLFFAATLLTIFIFNKYAGGFLQKAAGYMQANFLPAFGAGALYFIAAPPIALLLVITLIAFPFGAALGSLYGLTFLFARPVTAIILSRILENRLKQKWSAGKAYLIAYGLYLALFIVGFIPFIGWLTNAVAIAASAGSIIQVIRKKE